MVTTSFTNVGLNLQKGALCARPRGPWAAVCSESGRTDRGSFRGPEKPVGLLVPGGQGTRFAFSSSLRSNHLPVASRLLHSQVQMRSVCLDLDLSSLEQAWFSLDGAC